MHKAIGYWRDNQKFALVQRDIQMIRQVHNLLDLPTVNTVPAACPPSVVYMCRESTMQTASLVDEMMGFLVSNETQLCKLKTQATVNRLLANRRPTAPNKSRRRRGARTKKRRKARSKVGTPAEVKRRESTAKTSTPQISGGPASCFETPRGARSGRRTKSRNAMSQKKRQAPIGRPSTLTV